MTDLLDKIIRWEDGTMQGPEVIDFFAELVETGKAWSLQGMYGRTAQRLIDIGYISRDGKVLKYPEDKKVVSKN